MIIARSALYLNTQFTPLLLANRLNLKNKSEGNITQSIVVGINLEPEFSINNFTATNIYSPF